MTVPSGTPQPHRRRRRDLAGTPAAVLGMLLMAPRARVDPVLAAIACQVARPSILQAIHRLRSQGLVIITQPTPPGPLPVEWYMLHHESRQKAWKLLQWWSDQDAKTCQRYITQQSLEPTEVPDHDPTPPPRPEPPAHYPPGDPLNWEIPGRIADVDIAHQQALYVDAHRDTVW